VTSPPISLNSSSGIGDVLGLFANGSKTNGQDAWRHLALSGDGATISFDLWRLDSWDNETFSVYANDSAIAQATFNLNTVLSQPIVSSTASGYSTTITPYGATSNVYGSNSSWLDQRFRVNLRVPTGVTNLKLGFGSSLNQDRSDESYAIDNLTINDPGSLVIHSLASRLPV